MKACWAAPSPSPPESPLVLSRVFFAYLQLTKKTFKHELKKPFLMKQWDVLCQLFHLSFNLSLFYYAAGPLSHGVLKGAYNAFLPKVDLNKMCKT